MRSQIAAGFAFLPWWTNSPARTWRWSQIHPYRACGLHGSWSGSSLNAGSPERLFPTMVPKFIRMAILRWVQDTGIDWHYLAPVIPTQNAFIESCNETHFSSMAEAKETLGLWSQITTPTYHIRRWATRHRWRLQRKGRRTNWPRKVIIQTPRTLRQMVETWVSDQIWNGACQATEKAKDSLLEAAFHFRFTRSRAKCGQI